MENVINYSIFIIPWEIKNQESIKLKQNQLNKHKLS
jgi:hypothetical protein